VHLVGSSTHNNNILHLAADKQQRNDQLLKQYRCDKKTTATTTNEDKNTAETKRYETK
jgi:hypothetical protein